MQKQNVLPCPSSENHFPNTPLLKNCYFLSQLPKRTRQKNVDCVMFIFFIFSLVHNKIIRKNLNVKRQ